MEHFRHQNIVAWLFLDRRKSKDLLDEDSPVRNHWMSFNVVRCHNYDENDLQHSSFTRSRQYSFSSSSTSVSWLVLHRKKFM